MWYSKLKKKKFLLLEISAPKTEKIVPTLNNSDETPPKEVFASVAVSAGRRGRASSATFERRPWENFSTNCEPLYATSTSHRKQETFLYKYPVHWVLLPTKNAQQNVNLRCYTPQKRSPYWLLKPVSEHAHARLLPRPVQKWPSLCPSGCFLMIHIENLLRPLQLFYFHLWPVYWLSPPYFPYLKKKWKQAYAITAVCVSPPPTSVNFWMAERNFMELGTCIMALKPISTAYFINPSHQSVCVYPPYSC
jgi:hypothetical protein